MSTDHGKEGEEFSCLALHVAQENISLNLLHLHHLHKQFVHYLAKEDDLEREKETYYYKHQEMIGGSRWSFFFFFNPNWQKWLTKFHLDQGSKCSLTSDICQSKHPTYSQLVSGVTIGHS